MDTTTIDIPKEYEQKVMSYIDSLTISDGKVSFVERKETNREGGEEYKVKSVKNHRYIEGVLQFAVQFEGCRNVEWINDENCDCETRIKEYMKKNGVVIPTAYLLCRVSTKKQDDPNATSLETQAALLTRMFSAYQRIKVVSVIGSGYRVSAPNQFQEIADVSTQGDTVAFYKIDRFSRNIENSVPLLQKMHRKKVQIYDYATKKWYHEDKVNIFQGILEAQKESQKLGDRIRDANDFRRNRGDVMGRPPYGYLHFRDHLTGRICRKKNPSEHKIVNIIEKRMGRGENASKIARYLNSKGYKKNNRKWTYMSVRRIMLRKV